MTEEDLARKFNIVAAQFSSEIPPCEKKPWLRDLVSSAMQNGGHLLLGEAHVNGLFLKTYDMLAQNPEIFTAAAKNGGKHLVLEFPVGFQKGLDAYARKEIDRDELHEFLFLRDEYHFVSPWLAGNADLQFAEALIQTIDNALAAGMSVHFADHSAEKFLLTMAPEILAFGKKIEDAYAAEKPGMSLEQYAVEYGKKLSPDEILGLQKAQADFMLSQRADRLDDTELYNYLRTKFPAGEGILAVAGYGHLDDQADRNAGLNAHLEREGAKVTVVEIFDDQNTQDYMKEIYALMGFVKRREPDYTVFLNSDTLHNKNHVAVDITPRQPPVPPAGKTGFGTGL